MAFFFFLVTIDISNYSHEEHIGHLIRNQQLYILYSKAQFLNENMKTDNDYKHCFGTSFLFHMFFEIWKIYSCISGNCVAGNCTHHGHRQFKFDFNGFRDQYLNTHFSESFAIVNIFQKSKKRLLKSSLFFHTKLHIHHKP